MSTIEPPGPEEQTIKPFKYEDYVLTRYVMLLAQLLVYMMQQLHLLHPKISQCLKTGLKAASLAATETCLLYNIIITWIWILKYTMSEVHAVSVQMTIGLQFANIHSQHTTSSVLVTLHEKFMYTSFTCDGNDDTEVAFP